MKTLELFCEAVAGIVFGVVVFTFMFFAAFVLTIPEIPRIMKMHAM